MKTIKRKLLVFFGVVLFFVSSILGVTAYLAAKNALEKDAEAMISKTALESTKVVESRIRAQLGILETIAQREQIRDFNVKWEEKQAILKSEAARCGFTSMGIGNLQGDVTTLSGNANLKERPYYQAALQGKSVVTDPIVSKVDGVLIVNYAVPIKDDSGKVVGVLIGARKGSELSDITNDITMGKTGKAFMINKSAVTIAHYDENAVKNVQNVVEEAKKDPKLSTLAEIEKEMAAGKAGFGEYTYQGVSKYVGYAPIESAGWSIAIAVPKAEILSQLDTLTIVMPAISVVLLFIGLVIIYLISRAISKRIVGISAQLKSFSKGDFGSSVYSEDSNSKDEIGEALKSMIIMRESIREAIGTIRDSSINVDENANNLLTIAQEMSTTSENVAAASQETAKGIGNQAESLSNVTDILGEFGSKLENIAKDINDIDTNSNEISDMAKYSNDTMKALIESINLISKSFKDFTDKIDVLSKNINQITDITSLINSIAEQTNLLALNAAIEAARAGESGRGFAVVAEEIRKLAEQSQSSSKSIETLIKGISGDADSIIKTSGGLNNELEDQISIINDTLSSYKQIINSINGIVLKIQSANVSISDFNNEKNAILEKIDSASAVSEEVSASSEEIAASTEELSSSSSEVALAAEKLNEMTKVMIEQVGKFKI